MRRRGSVGVKGCGPPAPPKHYSLYGCVTIHLLVVLRTLFLKSCLAACGPVARTPAANTQPGPPCPASVCTLLGPRISCNASPPRRDAPQARAPPWIHGMSLATDAKLYRKRNASLRPRLPCRGTKKRGGHPCPPRGNPPTRKRVFRRGGGLPFKTQGRALRAPRFSPVLRTGRAADRTTWGSVATFFSANRAIGSAGAAFRTICVLFAFRPCTFRVPPAYPYGVLCAICPECAQSGAKLLLKVRIPFFAFSLDTCSLCLYYREHCVRFTSLLF